MQVGDWNWDWYQIEMKQFGAVFLLISCCGVETNYHLCYHIIAMHWHCHCQHNIKNKKNSDWGSCQFFGGQLNLLGGQFWACWIYWVGKIIKWVGNTQLTCYLPPWITVHFRNKWHAFHLILLVSGYSWQTIRLCYRFPCDTEFHAYRNCCKIGDQRINLQLDPLTLYHEVTCLSV